jgi:hypothetical protein
LRVACGCGCASCLAMKSRYAMPAHLINAAINGIGKQQSCDASAVGDQVANRNGTPNTCGSTARKS